MNTSRVAILHGSYGHPEENWFPWLAAEVRSRGHLAIVPAFPTPDDQRLDRWREVFFRSIGQLGPDVVLVAHSTAVSFVLHLLEESDVSVKGAFLVSGFVRTLGLPEFDAVNATFVSDRFNWERIRRHCGVAHVYHSDDDPYVPLLMGEEVAKHLGVSLTLIPGGGHLNASAGFRTFPRLLEDLAQVLGS